MRVRERKRESVCVCVCVCVCVIVSRSLCLIAYLCRCVCLLPRTDARNHTHTNTHPHTHTHTNTPLHPHTLLICTLVHLKSGACSDMIPRTIAYNSTFSYVWTDGPAGKVDAFTLLYPSVSRSTCTGLSLSPSTILLFGKCVRRRRLRSGVYKSWYTVSRYTGL